MMRHQLSIGLTLLGLSSTAISAGLPWYAGVSAGVSSLRPDTENSAFELDSSVSAGAGVFLGFDISRRFSLEAAYNELGSASLSSATGDTDISYTAISAGGLAYILGDADDIAERNGFSGFVRLGLSAIENETDIPLDEADNVAIWAGVGVEWPFAHTFSLRGELTSFDGDAQAARVSVLYRPRAARAAVTAQRAPARVPQAPNSSVRPPVVQPPAPAPIPAPVPRPAPTIVQPDVQVSPGANNLADNTCTSPAANEPVDASGCALFSGPLRGVEFVSGTASLTSIGQQLLDRLGQSLLRHPTLVVEIQAHTESFGGEARAKDIARQRALSVARHLAGRGVAVAQLRARAFGHSNPIAPDDSVAGRRRNNRIELRVLP